MITSIPEIRVIPIAAISVLNPRVRNKKVFQDLVTSIANLGLKKPITVSDRADGGYDLVCGQGRLEAFVELGQAEIPAVVVEASAEDCFVMSLVENLARRQHTPLELIQEIGALKDRGYTVTEIAKKTDFSAGYVWAICFLLENGEERLLHAVERGIMPHTVAMEIAQAKDDDTQAALAEAYERKSIPGNQILAIRRIIDQRNLTGKGLHSNDKAPRNRKTVAVTAHTLVRAYRKETDRQRALVKKANLTQSRLLFVVNALRRLFDEEAFTSLLQAESLTTLPQPIAERIGMTGG